MLKSFIKFGLVGGLGVIVNLGILWILRMLMVTDTAASAIAIEVSIFSNFLLNEHWTFKSQVEALEALGELGSKNLWRRALRFQLVSGVGALLQWSVFVLFNVLWLYWGIKENPEVSALAWESYQEQLNTHAWYYVITSPPEVGAWVYLSQLIGIAGAIAWNFLMNYYWTWSAKLSVQSPQVQ